MRLPIFVLIASLAVIVGCSSANPSAPDFSIAQSDIVSSHGVFGAYELHINPDTMTAELSGKRYNALGESYIVSGLSFFTKAPCFDCLKIDSLTLTGGNLVLTFEIIHPFEPGSEAIGPPSATNRLDLDVFDLAAVIVPVNNDHPPVEYPLTELSIFTGVIKNNAGYTRELKNILDGTYADVALPFVLVIDDSIDEPIVNDNYNKFGMGASTTFDIQFSLEPGGPGLDFDLYLTMGYGFSARRAQRLNPTYFNPEFNRKAAWKVVVETSDNWVSNDDSTTVDVIVTVYDWQQISEVNPDLDNSTDIYAESFVEDLTVEIPGMTDEVVRPTELPEGEGTPENPLIGVVHIANENLLEPGTYIGLVSVIDSRPVLEPADGRDFLIHTPDGIDLPQYELPEYITYQTFEAVVVAP